MIDMEEKCREVASIQIRSFEDIIAVRERVRRLMEAMGFGILDQTRIVTAVSELARNVVVHAKSGAMKAFDLLDSERNRRGLRCVFDDQGPGIRDIEKAHQEGFSTVGSLGLGLPGARRLSDEFSLRSTPGKGTSVSIVKWK